MILLSSSFIHNVKYELFVKQSWQFENFRQFQEGRLCVYNLQKKEKGLKRTLSTLTTFSPQRLLLFSDGTKTLFKVEISAKSCSLLFLHNHTILLTYIFYNIK